MYIFIYLFIYIHYLRAFFLRGATPNYFMNPLKNLTNIYTRIKYFIFLYIYLYKVESKSNWNLSWNSIKV